jgi:hypothetical protein
MQVRINKKIEENGKNYWYAIGRETEKAVLVELWYEHIDGTKIQDRFEKSCWTNFWLPKSQIKVENDTIEMPEWLYDKNISIEIK